jgi:hypothetical protein
MRRKTPVATAFAEFDWHQQGLRNIPEPLLISYSFSGYCSPPAGRISPQAAIVRLSGFFSRRLAGLGAGREYIYFKMMPYPGEERGGGDGS